MASMQLNSTPSVACDHAIVVVILRQFEYFTKIIITCTVKFPLMLWDIMCKLGVSVFHAHNKN